MSDRPGRRSVVPLPPDEQQRRALELATALSEPEPASTDRVLERLEGAQIDLRRRRRRRWTTGGGALAAATLLAILCVWRWSGAPDEARPESADPTPTGVHSGYARVETIRPAPGVDVEVRELTELGVDRCDTGVMCLSLAQGEIDVTVGPEFRPQILRVLAGPVSIEVTGTRFTVSRHGERVSTSVTEGAVSVTWPGGHEALSAGDHWSSHESNEEGVVAAPAGDKPRNPQTVASAVPGREPDPAEEPLLTAPLETEVQLLATIQTQRGLGRPADERLETLDRYLETYPGGDSSEEVLALRVEALTETGAHREAVNTAREYCLEYETGPHRTEVRWIEATVARDRLHDCELALPPYRELAADPGPRQAEAQYYLGMCAFDTGRLDEARDALGTAVELGLTGSQLDVASSILESLE